MRRLGGGLLGSSNWANRDYAIGNGITRSIPHGKRGYGKNASGKNCRRERFVRSGTSWVDETVIGLVDTADTNRFRASVFPKDRASLVSQRTILP